MKKLTLMIAVAALGLSCVANNGDSPIRLGQTFGTDQSCSISTNVGQYAGSLDLAGLRQLGATAAAFAKFTMVLQVNSDLTLPATTQNGRELVDSSRQTVFLDQIILNYRSDPALSFQQDITDIYSPLGEKGEQNETVNILANLLGPKGAQTLLDNVQPGGQPVTLHVQVQLRGRSASAPTTGSFFFSNIIEFPIQVFDSGQVCSNGQTLAKTGPCGAVGGQDGTSICQAPSTDGGTP